MTLTSTDRDVLREAVEIMRKDSVERARIDEKMAQGDDYWKIAMGCASSLQARELNLMPWQASPSDADIPRPTPDKHAIELLQRMLAAGLSRYEPNPVAALARAAKKRQPAPAK